MAAKTDTKMKRGEPIMVLEYRHNKPPAWQRRTFYMLRDGKVSYKLHNDTRYVHGTTALNNVRRASDFETGMTYGCEPAPDAGENTNALYIDSTTPQTGSPYNVRLGDTVIYKGVHAIVDQIDRHDDQITLWAIDESGDEHEWTSDDVQIFETAAARAARIAALRNAAPLTPPTDSAKAADVEAKPAMTATLMSGEKVTVLKYLGHGFLRVTGRLGGFSDVYITDFQMQGDLMDAIIAEAQSVCEHGVERVHCAICTPRPDTFPKREAHTDAERKQAMNAILQLNEELYYSADNVEAPALDGLVALVVDQYDVNPLAVKANKELDVVAEQLDAQAAALDALRSENARLVAERDLAVRVAVETMQSMICHLAATQPDNQTVFASNDLTFGDVKKVLEWDKQLEAKDTPADN